jgi:hypothetical protein
LLLFRQLNAALKVMPEAQPFIQCIWSKDPAHDVQHLVVGAIVYRQYVNILAISNMSTDQQCSFGSAESKGERKNGKKGIC